MTINPTNVVDYDARLRELLEAAEITVARQRRLRCDFGVARQRHPAGAHSGSDRGVATGAAIRVGILTSRPGNRCQQTSSGICAARHWTYGLLIRRSNVVVVCPGVYRPNAMGLSPTFRLLRPRVWYSVVSIEIHAGGL